MFLRGQWTYIVFFPPAQEACLALAAVWSHPGSSISPFTILELRWFPAIP